MKHHNSVSAADGIMLSAFHEASNGRVKSSWRHMQWFAEQRCAGDLMNLGIYPNAKELTESIGAFRASLKFAGAMRRDNPNILCVCVGDGCSPRTGALVACSTAWTVVSVDPRMVVRDYGVRRLSVRADPIEACEFTGNGESPILVLAVHSHAKLASTVAVMRAARVAIVSVPCCVQQTLPTSPDVEFADEGIWSPERTVRVWRDAARFG